MNWHSKVAPQFRWQEVFAILEQGAGAAKAAPNNHHILKRNAYQQSIARSNTEVYLWARQGFKVDAILKR